MFIFYLKTQQITEWVVWSPFLLNEKAEQLMLNMPNF